MADKKKYRAVISGLLVVTLLFLLANGHPCDRQCETNRQPMTCEYDFVIEWYATMSKACFDCPNVTLDCQREHCIAADGFPRAGTFVNRKLPGPSIVVCHNDKIIVRVSNKLDNSEGTTIHWHGIHQRDSQWMDGVPMITQCPIPSHTSFTYRFTANPSGTHWWHSHSGFHRSDGVAGPLVVRTSQEDNPHSALYDVDSDNFTVMIGDWLHQTTIEKFVQHHHSNGSNKGENILINGRGDFSLYASNLTDYSTLLTRFNVESGLRYRFRIISNAAVFCPFQLTIDQHSMLVISTDGNDVEPFNVTSLVIHGGERFDFVLTANQNPLSYWFRVQGLADCKLSSQKAILRYVSSLDELKPTSFPLPFNDTVELNSLNKAKSENVHYVTALRSVVKLDEKMRDSPDEVHFIGLDFKKVDNPRFHHPNYYPIKGISRGNHLYSPQLNNITFLSPPSPVLTQFADANSSLMCDSSTGENVPDTEFRECSHVINMKKDRLVELVIFDEGVIFDAGHPMHLHGYNFAVIAMERPGQNISLHQVKQLYESGSIRFNLDQPVIKDSVIIPDGGYIVARFITDNPGVWVFHCHLSFHVEAGMSMAFKVGDEEDVRGIPRNFPKCGDWTGGSGNAVSLQYKSSQALLLIILMLVTLYKLA
ncbi:unnamed protein product [Clavelina lepadiformis]|uniref:ferroxidase n=1 Tax=Clavelina lepadiformis TaxID=159417 RepID=A0ABP0G2G7_CLALP